MICNCLTKLKYYLQREDEKCAAQQHPWSHRKPDNKPPSIHCTYHFTRCFHENDRMKWNQRIPLKKILLLLCVIFYNYFCVMECRGSGNAVQIVQRHHFASHLKRMAVVVRIQEEFLAFVKVCRHSVQPFSKRSICRLGAAFLFVGTFVSCVDKIF